ncbi:MAG: prepilin peptidase [Candidatus Korobacteraceae bacterium]
MMPPSSNPYALAGGVCFALAGAACDLRWRRIPNRLTGAALLIALAVNTLIGGVRGLASSLAACLFAGAAFAIMFFMGGMGGGDVKLMAAIAAFAGLAHLPELLLATALAGGVFALAVVIIRGALGDILRGLFGGWCFPRTSHNDSPPRARLYLPYGVPIAVGALLTFYSGVLAS